MDAGSSANRFGSSDAEPRRRNRNTQRLLHGHCEHVEGIGLTCSTRKLGRAFSDIVDAEFHREGVIYGHFLSANSEDAVVSGWSAETHPYLWNGTLLLTKSKGTWKPLWYKSAVLTRSCGKAAMPSGREVLFCEAEDAGMGHVFHYVFWVDLTAPVIWQKSLLTVADSYTSSCVIRRQDVQRVTWDDSTRLLLIGFVLRSGDVPLARLAQAILVQ